MKKEKAGILLVAVLFIGLSVLLYPTLADFWNKKTQSRAIASYEDVLATLDQEDYSKYFSEADAYNIMLRILKNPFYEYENAGDYEGTLDPTENGIMGYITISRINVELPIYHGTSDSILNIAVGHLEGSSLPVGGEGTHCALSAHRGLPSAKLFTDLNVLQEGDTFTIKVLDRTLTYEVDQIRIVSPNEVNDLAIVEGEDYCTLITCTPYGINSHRLLVRGTRVENAREALYVTTQAYQIDSLLAAPAVAAPILLALLIYLMVRYNKKSVKRIKIEEIEYEKPENPYE